MATVCCVFKSGEDGMVSVFNFFVSSFGVVEDGLFMFLRERSEEPASVSASRMDMPSTESIETGDTLSGGEH